MEIGCYWKWVVLLCVDIWVWLAVKQHQELLWLYVITNMVVFDGDGLANTTTINPWFWGGKVDTDTLQISSGFAGLQTGKIVRWC